MATKKQEKLLQQAIDCIYAGSDKLSSKEWTDCFENGENNTNYVIVGLQKKMREDDYFRRLVLSQEYYMPPIILLQTKAIEYAVKIETFENMIGNALNVSAIMLCKELVANDLDVSKADHDKLMDKITAKSTELQMKEKAEA